MSASKKPTRICALSTILIGLGAVLAVVLARDFISGISLAQNAPKNEPWMAGLIKDIRNVKVEQLYAGSTYLFAEKLGEELEAIMFEDKHVEHDSLRGIYVTADTASSKNFPALMDTLVKSGGNAVVMDIETGGGKLAFVPEDAWLTSINPGSTKLVNLKTMIRALHHQDIYVIARQVIFNDPYTAARKPEWRIKYKWGGLFDGRWLDPSDPEAQAYNLAITREVAKLGFDEIQYDYIRFPDNYHTHLDYDYDETTKKRWEVINDFMKEAKKVTEEYGVKLGMDVFGATIWGDVDWDLVGQYIPELAKSVDVIYPMTYPSHVSPGYNGFRNPYGDPYTFVQASIKKFVEASAGNAEIRTWVQGFALRIPNYGPWFVEEQIKATYDAGANDFVVWNASNKYDTSWSSLKLLPPAPKPPESTE